MISMAEMGSTMPIATSLAWHRELGEPTRWSPLSRRNDPIAMAGPVAAMMTGTGKVRSRMDSSKPPASIPSAAAASPELNTDRSNPALRTRELPASTMAFTSPAPAAASARSNASLRCCWVAGDRTLTLPSSSVIVATFSVSS